MPYWVVWLSNYYYTLKHIPTSLFILCIVISWIHFKPTTEFLWSDWKFMVYITGEKMTMVGILKVLEPEIFYSRG